MKLPRIEIWKPGKIPIIPKFSVSKSENLGDRDMKTRKNSEIWSEFRFSEYPEIPKTDIFYLLSRLFTFEPKVLAFGIF